MKKLLFCLSVCFVLSVQHTFAQEQSDPANYTISAAVSPFGGALNFAVHLNDKSAVFFGLGAYPEGNALFTTPIDGFGDFEMISSASWAGVFVQHRPFEKADWLRLNAGLAAGSIENTITDDNGEVYTANYKENPVMYAGLGIGQRNKKGLVLGFDIGALYGAGPVITGPNADKVQTLSETYFTNVLPNIQFSIGYGF